eukprot:1712299-Alexandrium_andersonii.AAC.1
MNQRAYLDELQPLPVSREQRKRLQEPLTERQRTEARGLICKLLWFATQTGVLTFAPVSLLQGQLPTATLQIFLDVNKVVRFARTQAIIPLRIFPLKEVAFCCWSDSAWAARPDGSSQGGYLCVACEPDLLSGQPGKCSIISYGSAKLRRQA